MIYVKQTGGGEKYTMSKDIQYSVLNNQKTIFKHKCGRKLWGKFDQSGEGGNSKGSAADQSGTNITEWGKEKGGITST